MQEYFWPRTFSQLNVKYDGRMMLAPVSAMEQGDIVVARPDINNDGKGGVMQQAECELFESEMKKIAFLM